MKKEINGGVYGSFSNNFQLSESESSKFRKKYSEAHKYCPICGEKKYKL